MKVKGVEALQLLIIIKQGNCGLSLKKQEQIAPHSSYEKGAIKSFV
jgi:hypothetical protein